MTTRTTSPTLSELLAENERLRVGLSRLAELCEGILGADDDDRISEIRVHFSDRPSMYLRNALAMTLDAIGAATKEQP